MPAYGEKKGKASSSKSKDVFDFEADSDISKREVAVNVAENGRGSKRGKKRSFETPSTVDFYDSMEEDQDDEAKECGDIEMQNLLASFGADIRKTIATKKKNVHQFTAGALKTTDKKVGEIWKKQKSDRSKLIEEYSKSIKSAMNQWDIDVAKLRESEEEYQTLFQQMFKTMQQQRVVQTQRIKTVLHITEQLHKSFDELENCHFEQQNNVQGELKKEMTQLQKKIIKETQQQELSNVRKSLQTMLAQV